MGSESLSPSPIAVFLLELAERKASGTLDVAGRRISLGDGDVLGVWPNDRDESIGEFLAKSGRIAEHQLRQARTDAEADQVSIEAILVQQRTITENELNNARRALWLDRLVRAMRDAREQDASTPALEPGNPPRTHTQTVRTVTLTLDALARCAAESDAIEVGSRLNERLTWIESPHGEVAQRWAAFGTLPERPAVSTILARNPAAAPHIAALLRAGLATLSSAGQVPARKREITLPPPPPRLSPIAAPSAPLSVSEPPTLSSAPRPPRVRLDPGADTGPVPTIERVSLRTFPAPVLSTPDPIKVIEDQITRLEEQHAPAAQRADAYCNLAEAYLSRLGSVEDAARAYREAAAASPSHTMALEHAARLCNTLGQADLALAYANAIVFAAHNGQERAHALRLAASLGRPTGQADVALEALCEAAAEDETDPEPHEIVARSLAERGNLEGAIAHGRLAASVWMSEHPDRARSLIAWVDELGPADPARAREHARALLATEHPEAAVAILAAAARAVTDPDEKRSLMLEAAQQAESGGRVDLAAELLTEAFDAEPHVDIFYEPLLADLAAAAMHAERAVIAGEIALFTDGEARAEWLCIAGEAMLQVSRGNAVAVQLFAQAIDAHPTSTRALDALREHAATGRDRERLADALARAASAHAEDDVQQAAKLGNELVALAEDQLGAIRRALAAAQDVARLFPEDALAAESVVRLTDKARIQDGLVAAAEREVESALPEHRSKALRGLIAMLRDLPESRAQLAALHREYLDAHPDDETMASSYDWLLGVCGEWSTLASWLRSRLEHTMRGPERIRLLDRLMLACAQEGNDRAVAEAALSLLSTAPEHPEAIARLSRAAVRLNDATLRREALTRSAQVALNGRMRGRALSLLSALLERTGELDAAVAAADQALLCDRSAADAALLLLRHAYRLPTERATAALDLSRAALGDSQPLLSTLARAAMAAGDLMGQQRALDAWCRLSPLDPEANLTRLAARMKGENPQAIRQAAESCLALDVVGPSTATALRGAIARVASLGAIDQAASLALHALTVLGVRDANLLDQAVDLARRSGQRLLLTGALEHRLATTEGAARLSALRDIAEHHRNGGDAVAEAHALVRLLPSAPGDTATLDRLATLYAEQGDGERLLAALSLAARDVTEPAERRRRLLDMAAAAGHVLHDHERALGYVRALVRDLASDRDSLLHALGALLSIRNDDRLALQDAMAIAKESEVDLGGTICEWVAKTAEESLNDPTLALALAAQGLDSFPNQPGLLLMVERLALARQDVDAAMGTYDKLVQAAMGHHGKRALFYRAGRWLERAGRPAQALDEYVRAFELSPGAGVAFRAIERVARDTGKLTSLVHVYETLADVMRQQNVQGELLQQAAELCLDGANDHARAFRLLLKAWRVTGENDLQARLTTLGTALWERDVETGRALLADLVATINERAEKTWDGGAKVDSLVEVARIEHDLLGHPDAALIALKAALDAATGDDVGAESLGRLKQLQARLTPEAVAETDLVATPERATSNVMAGLSTVAANDGLESTDSFEAEPTAATAAEPEIVPPPSSEPPVTDAVVDAPVLASQPSTPTPTPRPASMVPGPEDAPFDPWMIGASPQGAPARPSDSTAPENITAPYEAIAPEAAEASRSERKRQTGSYERPSINPPPPSIPVGITTSRSGGTLPQTHRSALLDDAQIVTAPEAKEQTPPATAASMRPTPRNMPVTRTRQDVLRDAIAQGDVAVCEELADLLATSSDGLAEAHALLRTLVERQPWRTRALRKLLSLGARVEAVAEERTVSEILSVFDTSIAATACSPFGHEQWPDDDMGAALAEGNPPEAARVMAMTWEAAKAMPRFRKHLNAFDVAERDRVMPGVAHPVADAMLWAASTLRLESIPLYLRRHDDPRAFVAATNPPCLIATTGAARLGSTLLFQLGSALVRCRPEHVLLATLAPEEGRTLVHAINAAFGPAGAPVSRDAAQLASELWHTMPMRTQREVRDVLARIHERLDYDVLIDRLTQTSTRAGLMVAGSPRHAIFALTVTDAECRRHDLTTEDGFVAAAHASAALQAVIRFALSDAYLLARTQL